VAAADLGRPEMRMTVVDNEDRPVFGSAQPRDWREGLAMATIAFFGMPTLVAPVPGGHVVLSPNPARLVDWVVKDFVRTVPSMLLAIVIAYGFARLIAAQAIRPLRELTRALQALAEGDLIPKPIVATGAAEINTLTAAYNAAAVSVQKAVTERDLATDSIRHFISDASHELKTPLTIIMGYIDAVSSGLMTDPRDAERILKKTLAECRRMRGTIEKLLLLTRLDRDESHDVRDVDVATLTRQVAESMRPLAPKLHVEITSDGGDARSLGDETELREALVNIIDNAVKYAPGSPIDVRVTPTAEVVVVEIADAGPGMTAQDRERAFERFYRGSTRGEVEGSGLGLAIAKRAVQRANGRITLSSDVGRGTTVKIYLPAVTTDGGYADEPGGR